jgi:hypothetical protein
MGDWESKLILEDISEKLTVYDRSPKSFNQKT